MAARKNKEVCAQASRPGIALSAAQEEARSSDAKSILVSAAAGSGKTTVLTHRAVRIITEHAERVPADAPYEPEILRLLVVTFTEAAAAEMRNRLINTLYEAADALEDGTLLKRRLRMEAEAASGAPISTIHSACARLVREYYDIAGVTPGFRTMTNDEDDVLKSECMGEFLSQLYAEQHPFFLRFLGEVGGGDDDRSLTSEIRRIHRAMEGQIDPEGWAAGALGRPGADIVRAIQECLELAGTSQAYAMDREFAAMLGQKDSDARREIAQILEENDPNALAEEIDEAHRDASDLIALVLRFYHMYHEKKRAIDVLSFSDLEAYAARVLEHLREHEPSVWPLYDHVFIDEYQDVNPIQDIILKRIADGAFCFKVGDIKQSIYKFRGSEPQIFADEVRRLEDGNNPDVSRVIRMNENYRSGRRIVDFVNASMEHLMTRSCGEVDYTEDEALVYQSPVGEGVKPEIIFADENKTQAETIAERIDALLPEDPSERARKCDGIMILFRSAPSWLDDLRRALASRGIPYSLQLTRKSWCSELDVFVNLLTLIQDERSDVALVSVMRSHFFGFSEEEMMRIAAAGRKDDAYLPFAAALSAFRRAHDEGTLPAEDEGLWEKTEAIADLLDDLRAQAAVLSLQRTAEYAAARTDFEAYLLTRPDGVRKRNMFCALLSSLDSRGNSFAEVLRSVRCAAARPDGDEIIAPQKNVMPGTVCIRTLHSAKGLETPVVFLAGTEKRANVADIRSHILLRAAYGPAPKLFDPQTGEWKHTLETELVKRAMLADLYSEEMRLLYVALTRAREQLFICGTKNLEKTDSKSTAHSFRRWIEDALDAASTVADTVTVTTSSRSGTMGQQTKKPAPAESLIAAADRGFETREWPSLPLPNHVQESVRVTTPEHEQWLRSAAGRAFRRRALASAGGHSGAARGSLLHRALEHAMRHEMDYCAAVEDMQTRQLLTQDEQAQLRSAESEAAVAGFLSHPLCARARGARHMLLEHPFTADADAGTRMHGVIDLAFFEEGAGWVIVDYKSDRNTSDVQLRKRHEQQIRAYARALRDLTGEPVHEAWIFSLESGGAVRVLCESGDA